MELVSIVLWFLLFEVAKQCSFIPHSGDCEYKDLPKVNHGSFSVSNKLEIADIGATLNVKCNSGYRSHNSIVRCERIGRWSRVLGGSCYKEYKSAGYGRFTRLHWAALNGDLSTLKIIVEDGANLTAKSNEANYGSSAIHMAAYHGHLGVVKYLISIQPTLVFDRDIGSGALPLHWAALNGKIKAMKYLVFQAQADVNAKDRKYERTALHSASEKGHVEAVKFLLSRGANARWISNDYDHLSFPIHLAAEFGHLPVVKYLVENFDVDMTYVKNANGEIAFHRAALGGHASVVSYFVNEQNVDIEVRDDLFGRTALHKASGNGHLAVVQWLVAHGANVTATTVDSRDTPVHLAATFGQLSVVKYLVEKHPYLKNVTNKFGDTPLRHSERGRTPESESVVDYLKNQFY